MADSAKRGPPTPYSVWTAENPGLPQPTDETLYPSYPKGGRRDLRYCSRERAWKPKSEFRQDPLRPGEVEKTNSGELYKSCSDCRFYPLRQKFKAMGSAAAGREAQQAFSENLTLKKLQKELAKLESGIASSEELQKELARELQAKRDKRDTVARRIAAIQAEDNAELSDEEGSNDQEERTLLAALKQDHEMTMGGSFEQPRQPEQAQVIYEGYPEHPFGESYAWPNPDALFPQLAPPAHESAAPEAMQHFDEPAGKPAHQKLSHDFMNNIDPELM